MGLIFLMEKFMTEKIGPKFSFDYTPGEETYLITSEGGSGHKIAADAIQQRILIQANNAKGVVRRADVLKSALIPDFISVGKMHSWDKAKREGDIKTQTQLVTRKFFGINSFTIAEFLFFIPIFFKTFFTIWRNKQITRIIDTQPLGTTAIVRAVRFANFLFRRHVCVYKVMTDMPTREAFHFADSAKWLTARDKQCYRLLSTAPLRKFDKETDENYMERMDAWWRENFKLSLKKGEVLYADFPLRPAFAKKDTADLGIKLNHEEEVHLLKRAGLIQGELQEKDEQVFDPKNQTLVENTYSFLPIDVKDEDKVGLITIGSQANESATKAYIEDVVALVNQYNAGTEEPKRFHLFVACGRHIPGKPTLFAEVAEMIESKKKAGDFPKNLNIVPMGFQGDKEMASVMKRADFGVYGAGGLTTMETYAVSDPKRAHIFIHSDLKEKVASQEELLKGYALWEKGNAEFQLSHGQYSAKLVIPHEVFSKNLKEVLEKPINLGAG